jgi:hypothetical protein
MMDRWTFVGAIGGILLVAPLTAPAQRAQVLPRIGVLTAASLESPEMQLILDALHRGLRGRIWCEYADALGMMHRSTLAGEPRELVPRALTLDPAHPKALEMEGSADFEGGEFTSTTRYWRQLLAQLPERSNESDELAAAIARAERFEVAAGGRADAGR